MRSALRDGRSRCGACSRIHARKRSSLSSTGHDAAICGSDAPAARVQSPSRPSHSALGISASIRAQRALSAATDFSPIPVTKPNVSMRSQDAW